MVPQQAHPRCVCRWARLEEGVTQLLVGHATRRVERAVDVGEPWVARLEQGAAVWRRPDGVPAVRGPQQRRRHLVGAIEAGEQGDPAGVRERPAQHRVDDRVEHDVVDRAADREQARVAQDHVVELVHHEHQQPLGCGRVLGSERRVDQHPRRRATLHGGGRDGVGLDDVDETEQGVDAVGARRDAVQDAGDEVAHRRRLQEDRLLEHARRPCGLVHDGHDPVRTGPGRRRVIAPPRSSPSTPGALRASHTGPERRASNAKASNGSGRSTVSGSLPPGASGTTAGNPRSATTASAIASSRRRAGSCPAAIPLVSMPRARNSLWCDRSRPPAGTSRTARNAGMS